MKYIVIFHANLNYAYLPPEKYEYVIRSSYELIFDTLKTFSPGVKYVFEASGFTLEKMATLTPDVLQKLKKAIKSGQCEFMGSPYAHPMLANFPKEDGRWSLMFANQVYERYLGFKPKSFWNPECGWRDYVPQQVIESGYKNMIGDFEAFSRSVRPDGQPTRPEIYRAEHRDDPSFYNFSFDFDLPGEEKAIHYPFDRIDSVEKGALKMFLRTDRVAQFAVRYFMGMPGYDFEKYMNLIETYSKPTPGMPEGALIIFADDAEYIGTNGWFRLKYQNQPDRVFERTPDSKEKLIKLIQACLKVGNFITFDQACNQLPTLSESLYFDNDSAWHGARASTWASTPMAHLLRPWQTLVREKLRKIQHQLDNETIKRAWFHLTNSYNSDGQWPPTLPDAPHIIYPENYEYCFNNLLMAEMFVGGIDKDTLDTDVSKTVKTILSIQQDLVLQKARKMLESGNKNEKNAAQQAIGLIKVSQNLSSLEQSNAKILYPAEYRVRADALMQARRCIGGIEIEKIQETGINPSQ